MPTNQSMVSATGHELALLAVQNLYYLAESKGTRRQASLSAFHALVAVGGYWRFASAQKKADPDWKPAPDATVSVPFWIVDFLAQGWISYLEAPSGRTLGETLGIEGGGQGRRPAKEQFKNLLRDVTLALKVAALRDEAENEGEKVSLERAYLDIAQGEDVSKDTVKRAWRAHGGQVRKSEESGGTTS